MGYDSYADASTRAQTRNTFEPGTSIVSNWEGMENTLDQAFLQLGLDSAEGEIGRPIVMTEPVSNLGYSRKSGFPDIKDGLELSFDRYE